MRDQSRPPAPVLVVEDEPSVRALLGKVVERAGGEPIFAKDAQEARAASRGMSFVLVITDKNLPDGTGLELVSEFRALVDPPEVILVTGYANLDSAVEALRHGAFDYLTKPFELQDACNRIRHALELRELHDDKEAAEAGLRNANVRLQQLMAVDLLTGLPTPAGAYEQLERELARSQHTGRPFSVFRIQLGNLETLAMEGEELLKGLLAAAARGLRSTLRPFDYLARLSPESFFILCPEVTLAEAEALAERLGPALRGAAAGRISVAGVNHRHLVPPELPDRAGLLAALGHH